MSARRPRRTPSPGWFPATSLRPPPRPRPAPCWPPPPAWAWLCCRAAAAPGWPGAPRQPGVTWWWRPAGWAPCWRAPPGTWWSAPRREAVLERAAGDLVVRAQAGVPLAALAQVLAQAGQRLAVAPPAADGPA